MQVKKNSKKIKEENLNKIERNKLNTNIHGITLVALVVTIIVLIILAGVSINLVLGNNGIITKAKQAKENMEIAANEEQESLANIEITINNMGASNPSTEIKTVAELKETGTYMTEKTTLKDSNGNLIKVPKGFKIAEDSGINVTEGIVIEDNDIVSGIGNNRGNQYVWIPVGTGIKKSETETVDITLGRYDFADGENDISEDGVTPLDKGTPILIQNINDYTNQTDDIKIDANEGRTYCYEDITQRPGKASSGTDGLNATALSILNFKTSVENNGGYYIARYEASYGTDRKANSKVSNSAGTTTPTTEGTVWNCITQLDAATASRGLYTTATTDLINSYAWDTAIVYIQEFSVDTDYSYQNGDSINASFTNTGVNGDEVCKINDMASNILEWTTEYSIFTYDSYAGPCTMRGGSCMEGTYTSFRNIDFATDAPAEVTFRLTLYM